MDIISVSDKIEKKVMESEIIRGLIRARIEEQAKATAEYDKAIAKTIVGLLNGREYEIDNEPGQTREPSETIKNIKATNVEKVAKGICWKEKLDMDTADGLLKSAIENLRAVSAEMSAYQSLFRYLDNK